MKHNSGEQESKAEVIDRFDFSTLTEEIRSFIEANRSADINKLLLKKPIFSPNAYRWACKQIAFFQNVAQKLPIEWREEFIIFPNAISTEQASSHLTAFEKFECLPIIDSSVDLTGGLGIDSFAIASKSAAHTYVEPSEEIYRAVSHNFKTLCPQVQCVNLSAEEFIAVNQNQFFDLIYLDPSRRNDLGAKTIDLGDYHPNIIDLLPQLLEQATLVMVKVSPMISLSSLHFLPIRPSVVHLIEVGNELKEIVLHFRRSEAFSALKISGGDALGNWRRWTLGSAEQEIPITLADDMDQYLYEPSPAFQKLGAFGWLCNHFNFRQVGLRTHFFTSNQLIAEFPGKVLRVVKQVKPNQKEVKTSLATGKANIVLRNAPMTVNELEKTLKIKPGEPEFLVGGEMFGKGFCLFLCVRALI